MLRMRRATERDWARLFYFRSDPATYVQCREASAPTLKDHMAWLKKTLADPAVQVFVGDDSERGHSVGTGRLDFVQRKGEHWAECSVTVEPRVRGQGYAAQIIGFLVVQAIADHRVGLIATVKPDNYASLRAFAVSGFVPVRFADDVVTLERVA